MQDKKEESNEKDVVDQIGELAGNVKKGIGLAKNAAKGMDLPMPGVVGKVGKGLAVVAEAARDKDPEHSPVEKGVCAAAKVVVEGALAAPIYGPVIVGGAALGAAGGPWGAAAGGVMAGVAIQPIVDAAVKPYGDLAKRGCHAAFDLARGKPQQVAIAQTVVANHHTRNKAINSYQPNSIHWIGNYNPYGFNKPFNLNNSSFHNYKPQFISPFGVRSEVDRVLREHGYRNGINSLNFIDQMRIMSKVESAISFCNGQMSMGYSSLCNQGSFRNVLSMSGLISSYNSYNVGSIVREAVSSSGVIGGVASEVGLITDLINSNAHAKAREYFYCFPSTLVSTIKEETFKQIAYEISEAYFKHKTLPFFSLHFNNSGFMYPVIHPAYEKTLVGEVIAFLDYWMKGYLNGGVFDLEFLKKWDSLSNCDETYLRENLIDLKKYCKANTPGLGYISLRELESRYGKEPSHCAYNQPYMTSFRIIAYQEEIKRHENILIPAPTFRVEYTVELMPDYKEYLESYHREHGCYPQNHQNILECYERFAQEVKEKMPKLPFCQHFFQLLGLINTYCYAYATFEKMGKRPVIAEIPFTKNKVPNAFPPLPVRHFKTYPISLAASQLIALLTEIDTKDLDEALFTLLTDSQCQELSIKLKQKIKELLNSHVYQALTKHLEPQAIGELNEEEIETQCLSCEGFFHEQARQIRMITHKELNAFLSFPTTMDKKHILKMPLLLKIDQVEKELTAHKEKITLLWNGAMSFCVEDALKELPEEHHKDIREIFSSIITQIEEERVQLILKLKQDNENDLQKAIIEFKEKQAQGLANELAKLQ